MEKRLRVWEQLGGRYKPDALDEMCEVIGFEQAEEHTKTMLKGGDSRKRMVVRL